jgi:hypothetical protein
LEYYKEGCKAQKYIQERPYLYSVINSADVCCSFTKVAHILNIFRAQQPKLSSAVIRGVAVTEWTSSIIRIGFILVRNVQILSDSDSLADGTLWCHVLAVLGPRMASHFLRPSERAPSSFTGFGLPDSKLVNCWFLCGEEVLILENKNRLMPTIG